MATLGLCIITREYDDNIRRILKDYSRFFDEIYLQINGGGPLPKASPHLHISTYNWNDDFAAARNALLKHVKTDYWMWLDSDDEILNPEKLAEVVDFAEKQQFDLIYLPYFYEVNESGQVKEVNWRERLFRTSHPFRWHDPVHETVQSSASPRPARLGQAVATKHASKTAEETLASMRRNLKILEKQYKAGDRRIMMLYYLATTYETLQEYPSAIKFLKMVTQTKADSEAEVAYVAWLRLAICQRNVGEIEAGYQSYQSAIKFQPEWPDAYLYLGGLYLESGQPGEAVKWLSLGLTKVLKPGSRPIDPTFLNVGSRTMLAEAYSQIGEHTKAKQMIEEAAAMGPTNPDFDQTYQRILHKYAETKARRKSTDTIAAKVTLGLCIITREYDDNIRRILKDYSRFFDEIYLQINGGGSLPKASPHLHISTYKWNDDFAAARNALLKHVKTDYWMWLDSDDEILNPEMLAEVVDFAEEGQYDLIYLPYIWQMNQFGEVKSMVWRDRLFRTPHPFKWYEPIHENVQSAASPMGARIEQSVAIKHALKTPEEMLASSRRNLRLLEKQYESGDGRTMTLNYLANTYGMLGDFTSAIKYFRLVTQVKNDADADIIYYAWLKMATCQRNVGEIQAGYQSYQNAIKFQPDRPDAYLTQGAVYLESGQPDQAVKWLSLGLTKEFKQTLQATDPTFLNVGSRTMLAEAYSQIGEHAKAKQMIEEAAAMGPTNPDFDQTYQRILHKYAETKSTTLGLCIITREYDDNIRRILKDYSRFFDEIYLQINGGGPLPKASPHLHISTYKWNDDFAAARNALLKHVKTDYWMWLDSDDEILNPEMLAEVVDFAEESKNDLISLPYLMEANQFGEVNSMVWRDRIFRTFHQFRWEEPVHETVQSAARSRGVRLEQAVAIKHAHKSTAEVLASARRNLKILEKQYESGDRRATTLNYLANTYEIIQDFQFAIKFYRLVTQAKNDPEVDAIYVAWIRLGILQKYFGELQASRGSFKNAIKLQPDWPDAYLYLGGVYLESGKPAQAAKWLSMGLTKEFKTWARPIDPTFLMVGSRTMLAEAYSQIGEHAKAKQIIEEAAAMGPVNPEFTQTYQRILKEYAESTLLKRKP